MDLLHEKIRKLKNPSVIALDVKPSMIPAFLLEEEETVPKAYGRFCQELLRGLHGIVPAVRICFGAFALLGPEGLLELKQVLELASELEYYVLLDLPEMPGPLAAERTADMLCDDQWCCDGVVIGSYLGTDILCPFLKLAKAGKDIFAIARTSNKSAPEIQDLITGGRLVHAAVVDAVSRHGASLLDKCGYSRIAVVAAAGAADSLRSLRSKYRSTFLLLDGYDYPSGNAKNCSFAFDNLGHGAVACAGDSVTAAWMTLEADPKGYVDAAVEAALRMKKNLLRYVSVL